jgi:type IV secretory pathway TrbL component
MKKGLIYYNNFNFEFINEAFYVKSIIFAYNSIRSIILFLFKHKKMDLNGENNSILRESLSLVDLVSSNNSKFINKSFLYYFRNLGVKILVYFISI